MEQNFQTSFIPKQSVIEEREKAAPRIGIFLVVAIIVFLTMVIASAGLYFYKTVTLKSIQNKEETLTAAKERFEPSKVVQLQTFNKRLRAASEVLSQHVAVSPIFQALGEITMKTVRYTSFNYILAGDGEPLVKVTMSGEGVGYRSIALQSDLFSQTKYFIDPVFSNLNLTQNGNVSFDLEFRVEPSFLDYQELVRAGASGVAP
jgi:hypothetical protein